MGCYPVNFLWQYLYRTWLYCEQSVLTPYAFVKTFRISNLFKNFALVGLYCNLLYYFLYLLLFYFTVFAGKIVKICLVSQKINYVCRERSITDCYLTIIELYLPDPFDGSILVEREVDNLHQTSLAYLTSIYRDRP